MIRRRTCCGGDVCGGRKWILRRQAIQPLYEHLNDGIRKGGFHKKIHISLGGYLARRRSEYPANFVLDSQKWCRR